MNQTLFELIFLVIILIRSVVVWP